MRVCVCVCGRAATQKNNSVLEGRADNKEVKDALDIARVYCGETPVIIFCTQSLSVMRLNANFVPDLAYACATMSSQQCLLN